MLIARAVSGFACRYPELTCSLHDSLINLNLVLNAARCKAHNHYSDRHEHKFAEMRVLN